MKRASRLKTVLVAASAILLSCNVASKTQDTGGVSQNGDGSCPEGVTVVLTDYVSTQIALADLEGNTLSTSFISSASKPTDGLAFPLSGDVVVPSTRAVSGRIVLIDRFGTNVLTFVDPVSAKILGQLPVGTGFESNPHDYLEISDNLALVTRWGENVQPGRQAFDRGSDVLVIDTERFEIVASIPMPREGNLPPRPSRMQRLGDIVWVTLERLSLDFSEMGDTELAAISIADQKLLGEPLRLTGLKACGKAVLSPNGDKMAIACTGPITPRGDVTNLDDSVLLILDPTTNPPSELARFSARSMASDALQSQLVFATNSQVLVKTQTPLGGPRNNRWLAIDLEDGSGKSLLEARPDENGEGKGLVFGAMSCSPGCSNVCLLADSDRSGLQRVRIDASGALELLAPISVERDVGLPPTGLGLR